MESSLDRGLEAAFHVGRGEEFQLDLAISIPRGTTVALLGPNGAGKSTAVAALAGLIPIDQGHISLAGDKLDDPVTGRFVPPEARRVGVVFQDNLLFPHLSVVDNVAFGLRSRGIAKDVARARARKWIDRLGLGGLGGRRPSELSGGQARRVALARALVTEPDLLLLDEPLAALDVTTRARLRRGLAQHLESFPGPRLLITHEPTEAFLLADEVHVIEGGMVTQSGTADDIRLRPRTPYAADLAGSNLLLGIADHGRVDIDGHQLQIATPAGGEVLVTIRPNAISVHRHQPEGSARNTWPARIELVEHLGDRVRLRTGPPLPLTAEITSRAAEDLHLAEGDLIWVAIKATEVGVEQQPG